MARKLIVEIVGDSRSYERALGRSAKATNTFGKNLERTVRGGAVATVGFRGLGRSVAFASAAFLGGAGLTKAITSSISEASDLNEEINKSKVVFDQSAATIIAWSKTTATSFGISQKAALGAAGGFGAMLETAGLTSDQAAVFSRRLVELGSDIASFNNISVDEALLKLKSGLAGEAEPLRTVGVLLSEARVKQEAYRLGLAKAGATLTEQQKVQARYSLILKDTSRQQGDFSRTSGGLANQQRILAAQVTNLQAKLGAELLPVTLDIVRALNRWLGDTEKQEQAQRLLAEAVKNGRTAFQTLRDIIVPVAHGVKNLSDLVGGARNAIKLLIAVMVAGKIVSFTGAITGLSTEMLVATGRAKALRIALLRLGAIGVIAIGIELLIHRKEIEAKAQQWNRDVNKWLKGKIGVNLFGGDLPTTIPLKVENLPKLIQARQELAKLNGEDDVRVEVMDRIIARLKQIEGKTVTAKVNIVYTSDFIGPIPPGATVVDPGNPNLRRKTPATSSTTVDARVARQGQAVIDRITRQTAAEKSFGQQLADSITRAEHLKELLRVDPKNKTLQQRLTQELTLQRQLRQDIAQAAASAAQSDKEAAAAAAEAARIRQKEQNQRKRDRAKAAQFKALGLTGEGEKPTPGAGALLRRARGLQESIKGTSLDTKKTRQQLRRIVAVLRKNFKTAGRDVRQAILDMLNAISSAGDSKKDSQGKKGPLTATHGIATAQIIRNLGLSSQQADEIQRRLAHATTGDRVIGAATGGISTVRPERESGRPIVVESHTTINLDGQRVANVVTRNQQKKKRRNPPQKRGPGRARR